MQCILEGQIFLLKRVGRTQSFLWKKYWLLLVKNMSIRNQNKPLKKVLNGLSLPVILGILLSSNVATAISPSMPAPASASDVEALILEAARQEEGRQKSSEEKQFSLEDEQIEAEERLIKINALIDADESDLSRLKQLQGLYLSNGWAKDDVFAYTEKDIIEKEKKVQELHIQAAQEYAIAENARNNAQKTLAVVRQSAQKVRSLDRLLKTTHIRGLKAKKRDSLRYYFDEYIRINGDLKALEVAMITTKNDASALIKARQYSEAKVLEDDYKKATILYRHLEGRKLKYDAAVVIILAGLLSLPLLTTIWFVSAGYDDKLRRMSPEKLMSRLGESCVWLSEELLGVLIEEMEAANKRAQGNMPLFMLICFKEVVDVSTAQLKIWGIDRDPFNSASASQDVESGQPALPPVNPTGQELDAMDGPGEVD
jgi:hypothetical protein